MRSTWYRQTLKAEQARIAPRLAPFRSMWRGVFLADTTPANPDAAAMQTNDTTKAVKATMCMPLTYRVRVQGVIPLAMSGRLGGMQITISADAGEERSMIIGSLPD